MSFKKKSDPPKPSRPARPARPSTSAKKRKLLLASALQMKHDLPELSHHAIAQMLCNDQTIKPDSLRRKLDRHVRSLADGAHRGRPTTLTPDEESIVVGTMLSFSSYGSPLTGVQVLDMISSVLHKRLSHEWLRRFTARHRDVLAKRRVQAITTARLHATSKKTIDDWIHRHQQFVRNRHFPLHAVLNADETRLVPPKTTSHLLARKDNQHNARLSKTHSMGTLIPFVCADGSEFCSFYLLRGQDKIAVPRFKAARTRSSPSWPRWFAVNDTGYVNRLIWQRIFEKFAGAWRAANPGLDCLVYLDNCRAHVDHAFVLKMATRGVHCVFSPANTTLIYQPLDDACFGLLKINLGRLHDEKCFIMATSDDADARLVLDDAIKAETSSFNKRVVLKSWTNTGMAGRSDSMPNYQLVRNRAARWHQHELKAQTDATAEIARAAASSLLVPSATLAPSKEVYALVEPNTLYTADEIQEAEQAATELKEQQRADKEQRAETKRRQRDEEKKGKRGGKSGGSRLQATATALY